MNFTKILQRVSGATLPSIITDLLSDPEEQRRREFEEQLEKIKQISSIRKISYTIWLLLSIVLYMAVPELGTAGIGISVIAFLLGFHDRRTKEKELRRQYGQES